MLYTWQLILKNYKDIFGLVKSVVGIHKRLVIQSEGVITDFEKSYADEEHHWNWYLTQTLFQLDVYIL